MHSHECWMGFSGFLQHSPPALNSSSIILFKLLIGIAIGRGSDLNGSTLSKPLRYLREENIERRFLPSSTQVLLSASRRSPLGHRQATLSGPEELINYFSKKRVIFYLVRAGRDDCSDR